MKNRRIDLMLMTIILTAVHICIAGTRSAMAFQDHDSNVVSARRVVEEHLSKLQARGATVMPITDKSVRALFPDDFLFGVRFRMYPVAMVPPDPLKSQNLICVRGEATTELTSLDTLKVWYRKHLKPQKSADGKADAVKAWLALANELLQDGFYTFEIRNDSVTTSPAGPDTEVSATSIVRSGGKGEIRVTLGFDKNGVLIYEYVSNTVKPGPRPICQATKLLDRDPILRRMAERDILVMGQAAKPYLDEQRAKANPALQRAIDRIWGRILDEGW